jgi:copper homeostasis protein
VEPLTLVEAYVTSLEEARAAEAAGVDRIELCGPGDGGLTPDRALLASAIGEARIPVHVMIRPREGGFVYTADEFAAMQQAVVAAKDAGAVGVVFGVLEPGGALDAARMQELIALARPMRVACHRAFDRTPDADAALETLIAFGVDHVLTSGHALTAIEGVSTLARHVRQAAGRITVMAGGSVRASNVREIVRRTGVSEVHARATEPAVIGALVAELKRTD